MLVEDARCDCPRYMEDGEEARGSEYPVEKGKEGAPEEEQKKSTLRDKVAFAVTGRGRLGVEAQNQGVSTKYRIAIINHNSV